MTNKLFAVYLGGSAPKGNTELHDVVFVTGKSIKATYEQLMDKWFGTPVGLHLDSWIELDIVDGHRVRLTKNRPENGKKLFFVNLGAYKEGEFGEAHANGFVVAVDALEAKQKGKAILFKDWPSPTHTDNILEIDDCIEIGEIGAYHVALEKTDEVTKIKPVNGYHIIPKSIVAEYVERKGR